tara:strand:- start:27700 stop:28161 length:462 start_codon:yes stop_codon:yes gene_type:complete
MIELPARLPGMAALDQRVPQAKDIAKAKPIFGQSGAAEIFTKCAGPLQQVQIWIFFLPERIMFGRIEMNRLVTAAVPERIANLIAFEAFKAEHRGIIRRHFGYRAHFAIIAKWFRGAYQQLVELGPYHHSLLAEQVHIGNSPLTMLEGGYGNQ